MQRKFMMGESHAQWITVQVEYRHIGRHRLLPPINLAMITSKNYHRKLMSFLGHIWSQQGWYSGGWPMTQSPVIRHCTLHRASPVRFTIIITSYVKLFLVALRIRKFYLTTAKWNFWENFINLLVALKISWIWIRQLLNRFDFVQSNLKTFRE